MTPSWESESAEESEVRTASVMHVRKGYMLQQRTKQRGDSRGATGTIKCVLSVGLDGKTRFTAKV